MSSPASFKKSNAALEAAARDKMGRKSFRQSSATRRDVAGRRSLAAQDTAALREEDAFKIHFEGLRIAGLRERFFFADFAVLHELKEGAIEILHAVVVAGFDGGGQFVEPIFFQHFSNGDGVKHNLARDGDAAVNGPDHALANDSPERRGQLTPNLLAFIGFEKFENAADGLGGVGG